MADLTFSDKRKLERLFDMGGGYVLDFSNRTFAEFIDDTVNRDIYDNRYDYDTGSKANRLRGFWDVEGNQIVGKLLSGLIDYTEEIGFADGKEDLVSQCRNICSRLLQSSPVPELDALVPTNDQRDFETVAEEIRGSIERNRPEAGLDRLHTFVIKFVRSICERHDIDVHQDKPLHSLFGEYVKQLRKLGHVESVMTERILKSSISTLESFNHVRNNQSLAHDNPMLDYDEALLIFNHVAASVRFIKSVERRIQIRPEPTAVEGLSDDIPF